MLKWYKKLYIGARMKGNYKKYRKKIQQGKLTFDIYLLTIAANGVDQIDVISANMLMQKSLRDRCPLIIGIAKGYDEALDLLAQMAQEVYKKTNTLDIKNYLIG